MEADPRISFDIEHLASYAGQSNQRMYLLRGGKRVAYMDYVIYQGEPSISMIEVFRDEDKRKGYGRMLVNRLANEHGGYERIDWGMMTPDGYALRQAMDRERGFDRADYENKHFRKDEMISLIKQHSTDAARFFVDLTDLGIDKAWQKWMPYLKQRQYTSIIDGIDMNDLQALSEWTRGSVTNENPTDYEPNSWIMDFVDQLKA